MLTAKELSESELSRCVGARLHSPVFPGPVAAWNVIFSIFLPSADVARGPTIVELLAEPFFSVELPPVWTDACAAATPPVFSGRDAALLKASRKRYGGDIVTIQPVTAADAKAAADAEAGLPPAAPPTAPGPVVVSDSPEKKKKKKAIATVSTHEIGEGPIGLTIAEEAGGRLVVATVAEGGQAAAAGVVVGGTLLSLGAAMLWPQAPRLLTVSALPSALPPWSWPDLSVDTVRALFGATLVMTLLALTEAAAIARSVARARGDTLDGNQEFIGQGLANLAGSFFSAYPASGSFNRSGVNVASGARSPLSAVAAALFLVLLLAFVGPLAKYLPLAVISGLLMVVAWGLIDRREIAHLWHQGNGERVPLLVTLVATVTLSLEWAILLGITSALLVQAWGRRGR
jgi:hypothetical protein